MSHPVSIEEFLASIRELTGGRPDGVDDVVVHVELEELGMDSLDLVQIAQLVIFLAPELEFDQVVADGLPKSTIGEMHHLVAATQERRELP